MIGQMLPCFVNVVLFFVTSEAQPSELTERQYVVTQVNGTSMTIDGGRSSGITNGMTGKVLLSQTIGGTPTTLEIAVFAIRGTSQHSSEAQILEIGDGFWVEPGQAVAFDQLLEQRDPILSTLIVRSNVADDMAYVDGNELGQTPQRIVVEPGKHQIRVAKEGYEDAAIEVTLEPGKTHTFKLDLNAKSIPSKIVSRGKDLVNVAPHDSLIAGVESTIPGLGEPTQGNPSDSVGIRRIPIRLSAVSEFEIMSTEVSVSMFVKFAHANQMGMPVPPKSNPDWEEEDLPMSNVTFSDAENFCSWVGGRIPTVFEWRASLSEETGAASGENWSVEALRSQFNLNGELGFDTWNTPAPASWSPIGASLVNLIGNVWEWVNPSPETGAVGTGMIAGGCWKSEPAALRHSLTVEVPKFVRRDVIGFRCVFDAATIN